MTASAFVAMLICLALIFASCSDNDTDPLDSFNQEEKLYAELFNTTEVEAVVFDTTDSASMTMAIDASTIDSAQIDISGQLNFVVVPESSITDSVSLATDWRMLHFIVGADSSRMAMIIDCSPEGTIFASNIIFNVHPGYFNNHPNANVVKLYIYNEMDQRWRLESTEQKSNPRLQFEISHFSKYAISD